MPDEALNPEQVRGEIRMVLTKAQRELEVIEIVENRHFDAVRKLKQDALDDVRKLLATS